jgi:ADP-ribose pyrophosphatase YjhB (NUDIX family)
MIQPVVRAVIKHKNSYLLVKHNGEDFWCLPGGKVDGNEDIKAALNREIVEELGVSPVIGRLLYVYQLINQSKQDQRLEFFFEVKNGADYTKVNLGATSHGTAELAAAEFLPLSGNTVLPGFLAAELPKPFTETQFKLEYLTR